VRKCGWYCLRLVKPDEGMPRWIVGFWNEAKREWRLPGRVETRHRDIMVVGPILAIPVDYE